MGILLLQQHLGNDPDSVKGFFLVNKRIRTITVNADLPLIIQKIIVAHELGHATLHRNSGTFAFHEVTLYDSVSVYEKEANLFAAELLLNDNEVLEALNQDSTFFTAASELMVPAELLDFKFRLLKWKGYKMMEYPSFIRLPIIHTKYHYSHEYLFEESPGKAKTPRWRLLHLGVRLFVFV